MRGRGRKGGKMEGKCVQWRDVFVVIGEAEMRNVLEIEVVGKERKEEEEEEEGERIGKESRNNRKGKGRGLHKKNRFQHTC